MNHLISIEDLDRADIERIVTQAERFAEVADREIKKVPTLRGRMVLNLFYEASTRTRSCSSWPPSGCPRMWSTSPPADRAWRRGSR